MLEIYDEYKTAAIKDFKAGSDPASAIDNCLFNSPLTYHGHSLHAVLIPKIYSKDETALFSHIVNITCSIICKITQAYLDDPEFRKLFPFSKELEELILTDRGYSSLLPIARLDIFYDEKSGDFNFCEINTDGTSAMLEDMTISAAMNEWPAHRKLAEKYDLRSWELFESWINVFMNIYATYKRRTSNPHVAIVDFLDRGTIPEFEEFKKRFNDRGISCEVCDIRDLTYTDGSLYSPDGTKVDTIYRRAVTSDIMNDYESVQPFINAVKDGAVCLIGSFCTQIGHSKFLFRLLCDGSADKYLNDEEKEFVKAHFPYTGLLNTGCDTEALISDKDKWIIKPMDSYASRGIYAGCELNNDEWTRVISENMDKDYIYQFYCPQYETENMDAADPDREFKNFINMSGLLAYDGHFAGIYSRLSAGTTIQSYKTERNTASFYVNK